MKLVWQDRLLTFWMAAFYKSFLASALSIPAAFSCLSSTLSFHLLHQLNKDHKISFLIS